MSSIQTSKSSYDLLVVGCGLYGSVVAHEAVGAGLDVLVIDRRDHIGGNCYTKLVEGINVHEYGPHIFHTDDRDIWDYANRFGIFNNIRPSIMADYRGDLYSLPFNMNTFHELWGVTTPQEAQKMIVSQIVPCDAPSNIEEYVLAVAGRDIFEKLVKGYTEKRWGRPCSELPPSVMRRIPLRFTYDDDFFDDRYQGIPEGGYTSIFKGLLKGAEVLLGVDYMAWRPILRRVAPVVVYTGAIDEYFEYRFGSLAYRGLKYDHVILEEDNHQGCAVINHTDENVPYMRVVEHKHFARERSCRTVLSYEYAQEWKRGMEPFYPMEGDADRARYERYLVLAMKEKGVFFGGRLGEYRYYDMHETIKAALKRAPQIIACSIGLSRSGRESHA